MKMRLRLFFHYSVTQPQGRYVPEKIPMEGKLSEQKWLLERNGQRTCIAFTAGQCEGVERGEKCVVEGEWSSSRTDGRR